MQAFAQTEPMSAETGERDQSFIFNTVFRNFVWTIAKPLKEFETLTYTNVFFLTFYLLINLGGSEGF